MALLREEEGREEAAGHPSGLFRPAEDRLGCERGFRPTRPKPCCYSERTWGAAVDHRMLPRPVTGAFFILESGRTMNGQ